LKVLFVYPPTQIKFGKSKLSPPLGVLYLASVVEKAGHDIKVVDMRVKDEKPEEVRRYVNSFRPDVVGISGITTDYPFCLRMATAFKKFKPGVINIMGGPHVTFTAEEVLEKNKDVDIIVRGEGEDTFIRLLKAFSQASSLNSVEGITFRYKGKITSTKQRPYIDDLDKLPSPARHLVPLKDYEYISIITSRGCPYQCTFCSTRLMWGPRYRTRSPFKIVDEMQNISERLGFRRITLEDDNFTFDQARAKEICNEIIKRKLDVNWSCSTRVDNFDRDLLCMMKKAGCDEIYLGIESGSQKTLNMVKKDLSVDTIRRGIKILKKEDIEFTASFIIGFPWETEEDIRETLRFATEVNAKRVQFHFPVPYPGTEFRRKLGFYCGEIKLIGWEHYHASTQIVKTKIPEKKLFQLYTEGILRLSDDHTLIQIP